MESRSWTVDRVAAANLCRDIGIDLDEAQIALVAQHMARHRSDTIALIVSRIRSSVLDRLERLMTAHGPHRGHEWSAGCRSAEEVLTATLSQDLLGLGQSPSPSKGQMLRKMMIRAREKQSANHLVVRSSAASSNVKP